MRLQISRSKNSESFYVVRSVYEKGKKTTIVYKKLGTLQEVREKAGGKDPYEWAKAYVAQLTAQEKEGEENQIALELSTKNNTATANRSYYEAGHIFLQKLFYQMGWNKMSGELKKGTDSEIPMNAILQMLLYTRILQPHSKKASWEISRNYLPGAREEKVELHQVYRALDILAEKMDMVQEMVYKSTAKAFKRNTDVLYYDCTNFFFEIEEEDTFRRYGHSKENRPNPIVQMGMFIDGDGIPLAFSLFPGNQNEQKSLKPLEKTVINDFGCSKFIFCSDAGLGSEDNRQFNHLQDRAFIITQSLKKLSSEDQRSAIDPARFRRLSDNKLVNLTQIADEDFDSLFYKEEPYSGKKLEQRMIITYSPKYAAYQKQLRDQQVERALQMIENGKGKKQRKNQHDPGRFVGKIAVTDDGEKAHLEYYLDEEKIAEEAKFDGFYAVCTDLWDDDPKEILRISERRWQIEECFRIMKTEFSARPVYVQREDRIKAHFLTCFLALLVYRLLERKLLEEYTCSQILTTLKDMNFARVEDQGYMPLYQREKITDDLHEACGFRTDYQFISKSRMREIEKHSKGRK